MATALERSRGTAPDAGDGLVAWPRQSCRPESWGPVRGGLRFVFYGRVSTEDWQNPVTSGARQREQAAALVRGHGVIVADFFDAGQSRTVLRQSVRGDGAAVRALRGAVADAGGGRPGRLRLRA
jgi:hypothetical protein